MEYYDKLDGALCAAFKKAEIQSAQNDRGVIGRWAVRAPTEVQAAAVVSVAESNPFWVEDWMYDDK